MKIQPIIPQKQNIDNKKENVRFTGAFDAVSMGLRFLETNQAWGANAVDLASMVIPRTTVDFVNRGPAAGTETMRREASGTVNHSLVGVYGTIAGLAVAASLNKNYGIKAHKIFADDETLLELANLWNKQIKQNKPEPVKDYLQETFGKLQTLVNGEWKDIPKENIDMVVEKYNAALINKQTPAVLNDELRNYAKSVITHSTGSESTYRFANGKNTASLSNMLESIYNVSKTFVETNVDKAFKEAKEVDANAFIKAMKKMNLRRSLFGLGIASAVGMSIQPLNIYLTKRKTGSDGFVGVEGRSKDNSAGFKGLKALAAAAFGGGIIASIGIQDGIKGILKKIQFKGLTPTLDQFKFIYGVTIMSRFMAARDKDELRESVVKDVLGFFNWLVLGNFVSKMTANAMDQNLINYSEKDHGKGFFKKIINAPMVSRDEVLHRGLKAAGIDTIENGKALNFKQMLKKLSDKNVSEAIRKETKGKLRALSIAQVAGYLYSGLILGVGIPKLNIYMTNKSEAKRKARLAAEKAAKGEQPQTASANAQNDANYQSMMNPANLEFLSKNM